MKTPSITLGLLLAASLASSPKAQNMTRHEYDAEGNLTRTVNPLGHATQQQFDTLERVTKQTLPAPIDGPSAPTISYAYDSQDQLTGVTDPRNLTTNYTVNGLGDRSLTKSPDTGSTSYAVNAVGDVVQTKDARGQVTNFSYDALHRLTRVSYAGSVGATFEYDTGSPGAVGKLSRMTDDSGQTRYQYDDRGRLLSKEQTIGTRTFVVSYEYGRSGGALGKVTAMRYPSGNTVRYTYNNTGQLAEMTLVTVDRATVPLLQDIRHQPFGPVSSWTWGSTALGAARHYSREYDLDGRIVGYDLGNGVFRKLEYDAAGRIIRTLHENRLQGKLLPELDQSYVYDNLDRLTYFSGANTSQGYSYDDNGNRVSSTFGVHTYINTYDNASNHLMAMSGPPSARALSYDALGNLVSDGNIKFAYNALGRMQSATSSVSKVTYFYNGMGERVLKKATETRVEGGKIHFLYDPTGASLLGEYDTSGQSVQETIYLGPMPVAVLKPGVTSRSQPGIYYVYADHIETPRVIVDSLRNTVVWRWDNSDPYGLDAAVGTSTDRGTFIYNPRFPGQYYDRETGLHYNGQRDYDAQSGRYIQSDPIGLAAGPNSYAYVSGNPLLYTDPFGLISAADLPTIPRPTVDFLTGIADAASLGLGPVARQALGVDGGVNRCSTAYAVGEWASLGFGMGRMLYAGIAKAGAALATNGSEAMVFRNGLKRVMRGPLAGSNYRIKNYGDLMNEYGSDAAIKVAAGRTNTPINAVGADLAFGGPANAMSCGCR
ncbi:RHS repeat-associated core domain-containing protein [Massilia endophytica]|uniref:RHS repeat-associated core domain-containing protein n=1 Tax=Massilia endophytica TaxID=2899220 RepID=UPI001E45767E|nr:RHS repeat-associated core domain-containing protein [Massilia endophytica]UGQ45144.1 type IV secretion protein Rhs [Massilia endophytica]